MQDEHRGVRGLVPPATLERCARLVGVQITLIDLEIVLADIREPQLDVAVEVGVGAQTQRGPGQAVPDATDQALEPHLIRQLERPLQPHGALACAARVAPHLDRTLTVEQDLGLAKPLRELTGARRPRDRSRRVFPPVERGEVRVGQRQLTSRLEARERVYRVAARTLGLGDPTRAPEDARQPAKRQLLRSGDHQAPDSTRVRALAQRPPRRSDP